MPGERRKKHRLPADYSPPRRESFGRRSASLPGAARGRSTAPACPGPAPGSACSSPAPRLPRRPGSAGHSNVPTSPGTPLRPGRAQRAGWSPVYAPAACGGPKRSSSGGEDPRGRDSRPGAAGQLPLALKQQLPQPSAPRTCSRIAPTERASRHGGPAAAAPPAASPLLQQPTSDGPAPATVRRCPVPPQCAGATAGPRAGPSLRPPAPPLSPPA